MPRIAFDISIISSFRTSNRLIWGRAIYQLLKSQMERKSRDREIVQRCHPQGIRFEPLVFEYSGDLESEGDRLLISVCRAIDENLHRKIRSIYQILK